ncbi:hypothetical protein B0H13DRAFT_2574102 [Mycena leptocephala]|nr:hypothetical protein B0H13DRAFT_2574102 [Mycena leptocephala]
MYGASAHWPYGNFSGTDAAGWNGVEGGGENDGQFDVQASNTSFPSISTPSPWPSAPSHNAAPSFGSSAHSDASHAGSMTFPDAFAQSIPYQLHHDGYHLPFGTELGANLSRAQYGEPLNYPLQLAALEQQLDFLTDPSMHPKQSTHDPWVDFVEYVVLYRWLEMTNALLPVPVARHRIRTLRNLIHFLKSAPEMDSDDASELSGLPAGSPLKFAPRRSAPRMSDVSNTSPVPVDISSINNLFEDCEWRRSDTIWLDDSIWSQYITFGKGVSLTSGKLVERLEQVHGGIPTELPHLSVPTAFILTAPDSARVDGMTMDNLFRSGCPHSFGGSTGKPSVPTCRGILACESLDESLIVGERRELDPNAKQKLAQAQLRTRELQGTSRVGQVFTYNFDHSSALGRLISLQVVKAVLEKLDVPKRGKHYGVACSERDTPLAEGFEHSSHPLPPHIDEGILCDAVDGRRVIDGEDIDGCCSMTMSLSKNHGGQAHCGMEHSKDGTRFKARMIPIECGAKTTFFVPIPVYDSLSLTCIAYPHVQTPHRHITASGTKCPRRVRDEYRALALEYGPGVTVAKLENSQLAKTKFGGKTPSQHDWYGKPASSPPRIALTTSEEIASYVARQQASNDPYIHSSISRGGKSIYFGAKPRLLSRIHKLRTLDIDTSFKPVDGKLQMFEVNGWLCLTQPANSTPVITVLRVWMESHDRLTFKDVWVEILRLISTLTSHRLRFKNLHPGGTLLRLLSDMEAAPLLGFADAVWDTLTAARQAEIGTPIAMLSYVLRICHVHFDRGVDSDQLKDLSSADREKVRSLKDCTSQEAFEEWKQAVLVINDSMGRLRAWRRQKEMHLFLLPGLIQALSNIDLDDWHLMPANTNVGEGQHRWNNIQTGVSMGVIESMKKYEAVDAATEARLTQGDISGDLRDEHNNAVDRCVNSMSRKAGAAAKAHRIRTSDEHVRHCTILLNEANEALQTAKYQAQSDRSQLAKQRVETKRQQVRDAEKALALAKAEANSNSSGRVPLPRAQTRTATATVFPTTTSVPIPSAGTPDPLQPIPAAELSEAPIHELRKRARAHNPSAPSLQPGKSQKRSKKGGEKELNLDWELVAGGERWWARDLARENPEEFKLEWPAYAHLVDTL